MTVAQAGGGHGRQQVQAGAQRAAQLPGPLAQGLRPVKAEHRPGAGFWVAGIGEADFLAVGLVAEGQLVGHPLGMLGGAGLVAGRLLSHGSERGAFPLRLHDAHQLAVY